METAKSTIEGTEIERSQDVQATSIAAMTKATALAHFQLALNRPRDMEQVRSRLKADCSRPRFAATAKYKIERTNRRSGEKTEIKDVNIRFAEAAARAMGNIGIHTAVLHESEESRVVRVTVIDYESNAAQSEDVAIPKTMERSRIYDSQRDQVMRERVNADGEMIYVLRAPDAELLGMQNALTSRVKRNLIKHLLPADILEEAEEWMDAARSAPIPKAELPVQIARMIESYKSIRVSADDLARYLGKPPTECTQDDLDNLLSVFCAIEDGAMTWDAALAEELDGREPAATVKADPLATVMDKAVHIQGAAPIVSAATGGLSPQQRANLIHECNLKGKQPNYAGFIKSRGVGGPDELSDADLQSFARILR